MFEKKHRSLILEETPYTSNASTLKKMIGTLWFGSISSFKSVALCYMLHDPGVNFWWRTVLIFELSLQSSHLLLFPVLAEISLGLTTMEFEGRILDWVHIIFSTLMELGWKFGAIWDLWTLKGFLGPRKDCQNKRLMFNVHNVQAPASLVSPLCGSLRFLSPVHGSGLALAMG